MRSGKNLLVMGLFFASRRRESPSALWYSIYDKKHKHSAGYTSQNIWHKNNLGIIDIICRWQQLTSIPVLGVCCAR